MELDRPDVVAEVRQAFERCEQAPVANDVETLDALFLDDPRTIRYGAGEKPLRLCQNRGVPSGALARRPCKATIEHGDHDLWARRCGRLDFVPPFGCARQRSAGRCRPGFASP